MRKGEGKYRKGVGYKLPPTYVSLNNVKLHDLLLKPVTIEAFLSIKLYKQYSQ